MGSVTPYNVLSSTRYSAAEVPVGLINGANLIYALANPPAPANGLQLYLNGVLQRYGVDYVLVGLTVTMTVAPIVGDSLLAYYFF